MSKIYALVDKSTPPVVVSIVPIDDLSLCKDYLSNFSEVLELTNDPARDPQIGWIKVDAVFVPGEIPVAAVAAPQGLLLASPNQTIWEIRVNDAGVLTTRRI